MEQSIGTDLPRTLPFPELPPPVHRQVALNSVDSARANWISLATEIIRIDPLNTPRHIWAQDVIQTIQNYYQNQMYE
tara:strand:- start:559 stop:789 length:231 start_codon:yes stop_codon:yes gene_type:complete